MALSVTVAASGRPEAFERAREITERAVTASTEHLQKDGDLTVELDWTDEAFVTETMGGVLGWTESANLVTVDLNSTVDGWTDALRATVAHEYVHTLFFEAVGRDRVETTWEYVLFEAQSQNFAERVYPDVHQPWRDAVDRETVAEWWPAVRDEWLDESGEVGAELFFGSADVPHWLGYTLSYEIGGELLADRDVEEFPHLSKADVVAAGNALYG